SAVRGRWRSHGALLLHVFRDASVRVPDPRLAFALGNLLDRTAAGHRSRLFLENIRVLRAPLPLVVSLSSQLSFVSLGARRILTKCQRPWSFSPSRVKSRCPFSSPRIGSPSGNQRPTCCSAGNRIAVTSPLLAPSSA